MAELVASIRKHSTRQETIDWLGGFKTKYKPEELNKVLNRPKGNKYNLWNLEDIFDPKSSEVWLEKGIMTL